MKTKKKICYNCRIQSSDLKKGVVLFHSFIECFKLITIVFVDCNLFWRHVLG